MKHPNWNKYSKEQKVQIFNSWLLSTNSTHKNWLGFTHWLNNSEYELKNIVEECFGVSR